MICFLYSNIEPNIQILLLHYLTALLPPDIPFLLSNMSKPMRRYYLWTTAMNDEFWRVLLEQQDKGKRLCYGWEHEAWVAAHEAVQKVYKGGGIIPLPKVRSHIDVFKKTW